MKELQFDKTVQYILNELAFGLGMNAQSITRVELLNKISIAEANGVAPISVTVISQPSNQKRNNPFYPIYKLSKINGMLGAIYQDAVNRQREREGQPASFQAKSGWGKHLSRSIVEGPNGTNIQIQPTDTGNKQPSVYIGTKDGQLKILSEEEWVPYVPQYQRPIAAKLQGVEKDVLIIRPNLLNIVGCTVDRTEYKITDLSNLQQQILQLIGE